MGKWVGILLVVMIACAVLGFVVDAVRVVAGLLFVGCLIVLAFRLFTGRKA